VVLTCWWTEFVSLAIAGVIFLDLNRTSQRVRARGECVLERAILGQQEKLSLSSGDWIWPVMTKPESEWTTLLSYFCCWLCCSLVWDERRRLRQVMPLPCIHPQAQSLSPRVTGCAPPSRWNTAMESWFWNNAWEVISDHCLLRICVFGASRWGSGSPCLATLGSM
jgi:hypothetical protein